MVGTYNDSIIGAKGNYLNGPHGAVASPNRNWYEILADGDNVPTSKIV